MQVRLFLIAAMAALPGCGDTDSQTSEVATQAQLEDRARQFRGKADKVQADSADSCERYGLYDDGFCDPGCDNVDPDCEAGRPISESLAWLCEFETEANGYCLSVCGELDADCNDEPSEEAEEEQCEPEIDHEDGECDEGCYPEDDDCLAAGDRCLNDLAYGDGTCDEDCAFADPDCGDIDESVLSDDEKGMCEGFPVGTTGRDLATSVCIGRPAAQQPACIAACAQLNGTR